MTQKNNLFVFHKPEHPPINLDDTLEISILFGDTGDQIGRLSFEEQPHYDSITYHTDCNKKKFLNNYMF
ncbi:MAG: hypothetical protein CM15mV38_0040 [uncultured marine virus]|nr:MAG: hypothetical protein CM15mV38_0040 [uncultured marine virus]